jgi:uncharacterized protein YlxW (UPF0749 family)
MTARQGAQRNPGRGSGHAQGHDVSRPTDPTMGLLHEIMYRPVPVRPPTPREPVDLAPAARRRRAAAHLVVGVILGAVTVAAVTTLRQPQPAVAEGRTLLIEQIRERAAAAEDLSAANQAISAEIALLQEQALESADPGLFAELEQAELVSGSRSVSGPGIVVGPYDPDVADPADLSADARVQDLDIQIVANGLWAAGAEAIAVNGQRLTALSAIRGAGQAILVDLTPLIGPYRVEAVGNPRELQTSFARSSAANHLALLSGTYGIRTSVRPADELVLPGSGSATLRYARSAVPVSSSDVESEERTP